MTWRTSKGFVRPQTRISRIENIATILGSRSSGARSRYLTKEDYPKLTALTEGGYAKDIFLKIDVKNKRIIIEDDYSPADEKVKLDDFSTNSEGILEEGSSSDSSAQAIANLGEKSDKVIVYYNGNWSIVKKHIESGDVFIPIILAKKIIGSAKMPIDSIISQLEAKTYDEALYVSSKKLASLINMDDLFSQWEFNSVLRIMLNTDMKNGPYKLKRENDQITINMNLNFEIKGVHPKWDCVEEIKAGFSKWAKTYDRKSYADLGYPSITVKINLLSGAYEHSLTIIINNNEPKVSNVITINDWRINNVGIMTIYNADNLNDYQKIAAHEFGHVLGLGDAYNGAKKSADVTTSDIMWEGTVVSENDIEMMFLAVLKNDKQYFYSDGVKIISDAIDIP